MSYNAGGSPTGARSWPTASPRRKVITIVAVLGVLVAGGVALILATASGDDHRTPVADASPGGKATGSTSAPSVDGSAGANATGSREYRPIDKPCAVAQWSPLEQTLGQAVTTTRDQSRKRRAFAAMSCEAEIGADGTSGMAIMLIDIFPGGSAEPMWRGLRGTQPSTKDVTGPGLGQGAYSYQDPVLGPHIVVWDGNLQLSVGWAPLNRSAAVPADRVTAALVEVARQTMARLST